MRCKCLSLGRLVARLWIVSLDTIINLTEQHNLKGTPLDVPTSFTLE